MSSQVWLIPCSAMNFSTSRVAKAKVEVYLDVVAICVNEVAVATREIAHAAVIANLAFHNLTVCVDSGLK